MLCPPAATGVNNVPLSLKWMLVYEEPETRTLWLGKATPRDWLAAGEAPLLVRNATTRYGRISFSLAVVTDQCYTVRASVTLPPAFATSAPAGGLRLRVRAPLEHAGKLSAVRVGGTAWGDFDAGAETVDFSAAQLAGAMAGGGLLSIVATFA